MQEIANDLGLSRITVSLVINGHAAKRGISSSTVEKVERHMRKIGYVRSHDAMALRTGHRTGVGILHCGHLFSHLTQAFNELTDTFADSADGVDVIIRPAHGTLHGLKEIVSRGVGRLVLINSGPGMFPPESREEFLALAGRLRTVIYNYGFDWTTSDAEFLNRGISLVGFSRKKIYEQMASLLKKAGHKRVLLADVPEDSTVLFDRQMVAAMRARGIDIVCAPWPLVQKESLLQYGMRIGNELIALMRRTQITAACFRDDYTAGGAIASMLESGIRIPDDLSVLGMDGHPLCPIFPVPLATFEVPVKKMVSQTIRIVNHELPEGSFRFECRFQPRASFGPSMKPSSTCCQV